MYGTWAYRGALFGLLIAIAYNTSAATASFQGDHPRTSFGSTIFFALVGLLVGLGLAFARTKLEVRRKAPPPAS